MARLPATITVIGLPQQCCEILAMVLNLVTVQYFVGISNISTIYGFSSSFSAVLHLNCIGKQ